MISIWKHYSHVSMYMYISNHSELSRTVTRLSNEIKGNTRLQTPQKFEFVRNELLLTRSTGICRPAKKYFPWIKNVMLYVSLSLNAWLILIHSSYCPGQMISPSSTPLGILKKESNTGKWQQWMRQTENHIHCCMLFKL